MENPEGKDTTMAIKLKTAGALSLMTLTLGGCASLGSLEDILGNMGGLYGNELTGEIRQVDTRRQEIELESGWGEREWVRYDGRTEVYYRQQRYSVRDLDRGDRVRIRLDDTGNRDRARYASVIQVQEGTVYDDRDVYSRRERIDGRVRQIDTRDGWFEVTDGRGDVLLVTLPYDPNRGLYDRFRRLDRGDRVRFEAQRLNRNRVEILRFL